MKIYKGSQIGKAVLGKKSKTEYKTPLEFKLYSRHILTNTTQYWHDNRQENGAGQKVQKQPTHIAE